MLLLTAAGAKLADTATQPAASNFSEENAFFLQDSLLSKAAVLDRELQELATNATDAPTFTEAPSAAPSSDNRPAWSTFTPPNSHWACHGSKPSFASVEQRGLPVCLKVHNPDGASARQPSRVLCLLGAVNPQDPPVYCYNDQQAAVPNMYLWWSPCETCGTAWRLFRERDDDQSWYKLPTWPKPSGSELPAEDGSWLSWTGDSWASTSMYMAPCDNPESECFVSASSGSSRGSVDAEEDGIEPVDWYYFVTIPLGLAVCCCLMCCAMCSDKVGAGSGSGSGHHGGYGWGGGDCSGGGGGDGGGGGGGDGGC